MNRKGINMKNFEITLDVTMSKTFEIEAESKAEAEEKIKKMYIYDFSNFHELSREIYEIEEV